MTPHAFGPEWVKTGLKLVHSFTSVVGVRAEVDGHAFRTWCRSQSPGGTARWCPTESRSNRISVPPSHPRASQSPLPASSRTLAFAASTNSLSSVRRCGRSSVMMCHGTLLSIPLWRRSGGQSSGWSSVPIRTVRLGESTEPMVTGDPQFAQKPRFAHEDDW